MVLNTKIFWVGRATDDIVRASIQVDAFIRHKEILLPAGATLTSVVPEIEHLKHGGAVVAQNVTLLLRFLCNTRDYDQDLKTWNVWDVRCREEPRHESPRSILILGAFHTVEITKKKESN